MSRRHSLNIRILVAAVSFLAAAVVQAITPVQGLFHSPLLGAIGSQSASAARLQNKKAPSAAPDSESPSFLPAVTYSSGGTWLGSLLVADMNGDGKPDIIVGNAGGTATSVGVLLGNGDGTFQPVLLTSIGSLGEFNSVAVADVDGDHKPDLIVATCCQSDGDDAAAVLLGNGDGTFQSPITYDTGGVTVSALVVADVNGDGKPDIVVTNYNQSTNSTVGLLLGNGDGTFQSALISAATNIPICLAIADVNHDGNPDALVCSGDSVGVILGNGDGTFQSFASFRAGGFCVNNVVVVDLNGDGLPDTVTSNTGPVSCGPGQGFAGILLGNGDGTFQPVVNYLAVNDTNGVGQAAVADLNGDGKLDVMVTSGLELFGSIPGTVGVLLGNGDGTFRSAVPFQTGGSQADAVFAADLNGDGKPDIIAANFFSSVGVLLNNTQTDTTPPLIIVSTTPKVLWPPKGKMVPVTVSGTITDAGSGVNVSSVAYSVTDEYGEVQPAAGISLGAGGSYSFTVLLQASRLGSDLDGRHYTITVRASDNAGNSASQASVVTVPHDRGPNRSFTCCCGFDRIDVIGPNRSFTCCCGFDRIDVIQAGRGAAAPSPAFEVTELTRNPGATRVAP